MRLMPIDTRADVTTMLVSTFEKRAMSNATNVKNHPAKTSGKMEQKTMTTSNAKTAEQTSKAAGNALADAKRASIATIYNADENGLSELTAIRSIVRGDGWKKAIDSAIRKAGTMTDAAKAKLVREVIDKLASTFTTSADALPSPDDATFSARVGRILHAAKASCLAEPLALSVSRLEFVRVMLALDETAGERKGMARDAAKAFLA